MRIGNFTATDAGRLLQLQQQQQQQQQLQLQLIVIGQVAVRHQLLSLSSVSVHVSFFVRPLLHCTLLTAGVAAGSALDQQQQQQETLRLLEAFQQYVLFSTRLAAITCNNLKAMPEQGRGRTNNNTKGFENGPVYLNCKVRVHSELQSCELYAYFV